MERIFLAVVGVAYILLAIWCSIAPGRTSQAVGFNLQPGSGQSEFLAVYGGLEFALGIVFLLPLIRSEQTLFSLQVCLVVHVCLVLFRSIGFFTFTGIEAKTYVLAAVEWAIFVAALVLWWRFE
jgi:hypothetical protein